MKLLFDLFPVLLFFIFFKTHGIYAATAVAIITTCLQVIWIKWRSKKVEKTLLVNMAIIVIFGGATLILQDETFIKWKPTVLYWIFAAVLLLSQLFFDRNLIKLMMMKNITLPDKIWEKVNLSWVIFFSCMGFLNLYFAFNFTTDTWVNFKLFGGMGLLFLFAIAQALVLSKHIEKNEKSGQDHGR